MNTAGSGDFKGMISLRSLGECSRDLSAKIKTCLDEARMLVLGCEFLWVSSFRQHFSRCSKRAPLTSVLQMQSPSY